MLTPDKENRQSQNQRVRLSESEQHQSCNTETTYLSPSFYQTQKSQDSKPVPLGLRKSKATGNLLAPSTQKEKSQKEEPKEDQTKVTSLQTESYSGEHQMFFSSYTGRHFTSAPTLADHNPYHPSSEFPTHFHRGHRLLGRRQPTTLRRIRQGHLRIPAEGGFHHRKMTLTVICSCGEFHDQRDAKWIVIRGQLRGFAARRAYLVV
jgi:hypothetical protein